MVVGGRPSHHQLYRPLRGKQTSSPAAPGQLLQCAPGAAPSPVGPATYSATPPAVTATLSTQPLAGARSVGKPSPCGVGLSCPLQPGFEKKTRHGHAAAGGRRESRDRCKGLRQRVGLRKPASSPRPVDLGRPKESCAWSVRTSTMRWMHALVGPSHRRRQPSPTIQYALPRDARLDSPQLGHFRGFDVFPLEQRACRLRNLAL